MNYQLLLVMVNSDYLKQKMEDIFSYLIKCMLYDEIDR